MPMFYGFKRNELAGREGTIQRNFTVHFPADFVDVVATGPMPVVMLLHGGGSIGAAFAENEFRLQKLFTKQWVVFDRTLSDIPNKCILVVPEGTSLDGIGNNWNSGHLSVTTRAADVDDVAYLFDVLERVEQLLLEWYNGEPLALPPIGVVLDRTRLMLVGFSNGGQMAFRFAWEIQTPTGSYPSASTWTVTAICVVGTAAAGWRTDRERTDGLLPFADWTPQSLVSLLWIQGEKDDRYVEWNKLGGAGMPPGVVNDVEQQIDLLVKDVEDYCRSDVSALTTCSAVALLGAALSPEVAVPHKWVTDREGPLVFDGDEWHTDLDGVTDVAVHLYHPTTLGHAWPTPPVTGWDGTDVVIDFLVRFGGL